MVWWMALHSGSQQFMGFEDFGNRVKEAQWALAQIQEGGTLVFRDASP